MAYKSEKLRKKVQPITLIIIGIIVAVIVGFVLLMQPSKRQKINKLFVGIELGKDHVIEETTYRKLIKRLDKNESIIVFFGSPEDENTRAEITLYNEEFFTQGMDEKFETIYFVDVSKLKDDQIEYMVEEYKLDVTKQPNLVFFKDNLVNGHKNDSEKFPRDNDTKAIKLVKDFYQYVKEQ